jgi:hypothetical protein
MGRHRSKTQPPHKRYVIEDGNSVIAQVLRDWRLKEILIHRADYVCLTDYRSLNNDQVVYVANGRSQRRVQGHDFRSSADEGDVVVNKIFREAKEFLQSRVAKHSRKLVKHLIGKQEHMIAFDEAGQQFAGKTGRLIISPNENGVVENYLH